MSRALIFSTTGVPMFFHEDYDRENHWRFTKPERTYDTCLLIYDDFHPEAGTYDFIIRRKGRKWNLLNEVSKMFRWQDYDYIGCIDDDFCTDIQSLNKALEIARTYDFRLFHMATTSYQTYPCMRHNPEYYFTETNFIECGAPILRADMFGKMMEFLDHYKYEKIEWGIDKIMCHYLNTTAHVVHAVTIRHCREFESTYDHADGFREMDYLMREFYPKYCREKLGREYVYSDDQRELRIYKHATTN
jgi:hypothetical protein